MYVSIGVKGSDFDESSKLERFAYLQFADCCLVLLLHSVVQILDSFLPQSGPVKVCFAGVVADMIVLLHFDQCILCFIRDCDVRRVKSLSFARVGVAANSEAMRVVNLPRT